LAASRPVEALKAHNCSQSDYQKVRKLADFAAFFKKKAKNQEFSHFLNLKIITLSKHFI
jgi:hypothetical protein